MKKILLPLVVLLTQTIVFGQNAKKTNVLFIAVDDLKPILGCYGNSLVKTPNIDRLAKMGTVFMNNYCQQAVCGPTRASVMTGTRPDVTKIWDLKTKMRQANPATLTLPEYLITQGYATVGVGKIYHPSCADKKFDAASWSIPYLVPEESDYANGLGAPAFKSYQSPELKKAAQDAAEAKANKKNKKNEEGGREDETESSKNKPGPTTECLDLPDAAYEDGVSAILAKKEIIELTQKNKPFFMAVGFHKPHLPFVAPKKYWDMYKREDMPMAEFQEHAKNEVFLAYETSGELRSYSDIPQYTTFSKDQLRAGLKPEKQKELIQGYYAAISYVDAQVGILLNTLDSLGTLNNTIIVLWGDHGWHLGDHDIWGKHTNFEQATRSPLIIAAPGFKAGTTTSMSEHVDIFPTICNLAGLALPKTLQGKSLAPIMKNPKAKVKDYAISQYPRKIKSGEFKKLQEKGYTTNNVMGYSLRNDKYRITLWLNNQFTSEQPFTEDRVYAVEMYDYVKDPLEKVNVANEKEYGTIAADLKKQLVAFLKSQEKTK